ncbi:GSCOCG00003047001-RA-CDS [Cotesia congregata]|nr:GSCOCG00003047001-RA-CDS [Cotesia congregata]
MSGFISKILGLRQQRVPFEEDENNGLMLADKYIPEELIGELLCYVDHKSLLNCQLVCRRWKDLIREYVFRKKAEMTFGQSLQCLSNCEDPWKIYYKICKKNPFERNLLKNHSGQDGLKKHWVITRQGGDHWKIESPPVGVPPLPKDPVFEGSNSCFVTSYSQCSKRQLIDLLDEGLSDVLLDTFQPTIEVGEWYSCRWDCPAKYDCIVSLLDKNDKELDVYVFRDNLEDDNDKQNKWLHFTHEFKNYGPGVRKILFQHSGKDNLFWAGHYGSKMAGASVIVKVEPKTASGSPRKRKSSIELD